MKTIGVLPEALAASISRFSRSEIDAMANSFRSVEVNGSPGAVGGALPGVLAEPHPDNLGEPVVVRQRWVNDSSGRQLLTAKAERVNSQASAVLLPKPAARVWCTGCCSTRASGPLTGWSRVGPGREVRSCEEPDRMAPRRRNVKRCGLDRVEGRFGDRFWFL